MSTPTMRPESSAELPAQAGPTSAMARTAATARAVGAGVGVRLVGVTVLAVIAASAGRTAHQRLVRWDANWYAGIAAHGYGFTRTLADGRHLSDYAFFPLYPALERAVHALTGLPFKDAGLVIAWISTAFAVWGVYSVGVRLAGTRVALLLVGLWTALPFAIVLSMAYSEALFIALAAWSLDAVLARRWLTAGLLAALAGLTRPTGAAVCAAVVVACVIEFFGLHGGRAVVSTDTTRPTARLVIAAVLAPAGWLAYVAWVGLRRHDMFGYFAVQDGWGNGFDGGKAFATWIAHLVGDTGRPVDVLGGLLVIAGVLAVLGLLVLAVRDRQPLPLVVFCGVVVIMALCSARYFGSKPRYLLPAFPLLLPVAVRLEAVHIGWARLRSLLIVGVVVLACTVGGAFLLMQSSPP